MEEILAGLNEAQKKALTTTEGYIRVIAGAGSGKTRALAARFAYLVEAIGILPGNILCVTFTNKSANEMRQRIHRLTGDNDTGYICTFHSFCVSILQEDSYAVSYPKNFQVLDNADIDAMLKIIYEERGLTLRHMTFGNARDRIEIRKQMTETEYYRDLIAMPLDGLYRKYQEAVEAEDIIFYGYLYQQKKCFGLDYNDLINFSLYIFEQNEEICRKWQERLEYIMIDEFQDIDAPQYRLMRVLCGYHKNLFVVGDPDQTIYTWRGANIRYLLDFDRAFPGTETISMLQNYRSTPQILAAANSLIEKNSNRIPKRMEPVLADGAPVICHYAEPVGGRGGVDRGPYCPPSGGRSSAEGCGDSVPCALPDEKSGGYLPEAEDPVPYLQRRPVLPADGDQGCALLSEDDPVPGRYIFPAYRECAEAESGRAAHEFPAGIFEWAEDFPVRSTEAKSGS